MNGYVLTWAALAAFALGYLGVAGTNPSLLTSVLPLSERGTVQALANGPLSDVAEQVVAVRRRVADLDREVRQTRSEVTRQSEMVDALDRRVAAAETRLPGSIQTRTDLLSDSGTATATNTTIGRIATKADDIANTFAVPQVDPALDLRPAPTRPPAGQATAPRAPARATAGRPTPTTRTADVAQDARRPVNTTFEQTIAAAIEPGKPGTAVRIINAGDASPITTGSVSPPRTAQSAPPASSFTAKVIRQDGPARAIEIGRAESLDQLRSQWGTISSRSPNLKRLAPRYRISADGAGGPFKLLAGPFANPAEAARVCNQLKARGTTCRVGEFIGNAL